MAINPRAFNGGDSFKRPAKQVRTKKTKRFVSANSRNWKEIPFIRDAQPDVDLEQINEQLALANAFIKSPQQTVLALLVAGLEVDAIRQKFGYAEKDDDFNAILKESQNFLRTRIVAEQFDEIPDEILVNVVNSDGMVESLNIADKMRKAITAAVFSGKTNEVKFSLVKGMPYHMEVDAAGKPIIPTLADIFQLTGDEVAKKKKYAHDAYGQIFRTRDTSGGAKLHKLPPALAALKERLEAESADESEDSASAE